MDFRREDIEALRLLRAFARITEPEKRRRIIELAEKAAPTKPDEQPSR